MKLYMSSSGLTRDLADMDSLYEPWPIKHALDRDRGSGNDKKYKKEVCE